MSDARPQRPRPTGRRPGGRRPAGRPPVLHITWQRHGGRAHEIARALGGDALHVHPSGMSRRALVPLRYAVSLATTVWGLARLRPRAVIVTNPPVFPGLAVAAYSALTRAPFVLDSHPGSFGDKGNVIAQRMLRITMWLARRASAVMVTVDQYVRTVESWGGRGVVVHEAPPLWTVAATPPAHERPRVLYVGVFSSDEPVEEVIGAAALLPDVDVAITGDLAKCPAGLRESAPANVDFVGFLGPQAYTAEVERADVVISLTTEPTSIMRSAYEAVYARRPLVVSDWPSLREVFPHAHHVGNDAAALAAGVQAALRDAPAQLATALELQGDRWSDQLAELRTALSRR